MDKFVEKEMRKLIDNSDTNVLVTILHYNTYIIKKKCLFMFMCASEIYRKIKLHICTVE